LSLFKNKTNQLAFILFILSFIIFFFSLLELPIIKSFDIVLLGSFLKSDGIQTIFGGIVSAYIFYIFIEIMPIYERERKTLEVLDQAIASIAEVFFSPNIFQHEKSIRHIKFEIKASNEKLKDSIENIKSGNINFLQLKLAMQTAHSRYPNFQNLLVLAVTLSPQNALYWLDLTDKVRLLADEYDNQIIEPDMNILNDLQKMNTNVAEMNSTELFCSDLKLRVIEFFESIIDWNGLEKNRDRLNLNE